MAAGDIPVYGRLHSQTVEGILAETPELYDPNYRKSQSQINQELYAGGGGGGGNLSIQIDKTAFDLISFPATLTPAQMTTLGFTQEALTQLISGSKVYAKLGTKFCPFVLIDTGGGDTDFAFQITNLDSGYLGGYLVRFTYDSEMQVWSATEADIPTFVENL